MAILNFTGFEIGIPFFTNTENSGSTEVTDADTASGLGSWATYQTAIVNPGGGEYALKMTTPAAGNYLELSVPNSSAGFNALDLYIRFYIQFAALPATDWFFLTGTTGLANTGSTKFQFGITAAGKLKLVDNAGTSTVGTLPLGTGKWYRLELHIGSGASGAILQALINGVIEINTTGNTTTTVHGFLQFGNAAGSSSSTAYIDDVEIRDNLYPGPGVVILLRPTANGIYQNWSSGPAPADVSRVYDLLNQTGNDGSGTYIEDTYHSPTTNRFSVLCETLESRIPASYTLSAINALMSLYVLGNKSAASAASYSAFLHSGVDSALISMSVPAAAASGTNWMYDFAIYAIDPATGLAWTLAGVDQAQPGIRGNTATAVDWYCTEMALMVSLVTATALKFASGNIAGGGGYSDLSDASLQAGQAVTDDTLVKISENAKFGAVRCETIFMGFYKHGDTIPTPLSPVDGYPYLRGEMSLVFVPFSTRGADANFVSGQAAAPGIGNGLRTGQPANLYWAEFDINDATGKVSTLVSYFAQGAVPETFTNDGVLKVFAICQRASVGVAN